MISSHAGKWIPPSENQYKSFLMVLPKSSTSFFLKLEVMVKDAWEAPWEIFLGWGFEGLPLLVAGVLKVGGVGLAFFFSLGEELIGRIELSKMEIASPARLGRMGALGITCRFLMALVIHSL